MKPPRKAPYKTGLPKDLDRTIRDFVKTLSGQPTIMHGMYGSFLATMVAFEKCEKLLGKLPPTWARIQRAMMRDGAAIIGPILASSKAIERKAARKKAGK